MADQHFSVPLGARSGLPVTVPSFGVVHIRHRHTDHFVVIGNHLAQHDELSLTARGLALYILSLPDGVRISIKMLAARFKEGETLIASCLRELAEHGYIQRIKEQTERKRWVTRTIAYDMPRLLAAVLTAEAGAKAQWPQGPQTQRPGPRQMPVDEPAAEASVSRCPETSEPGAESVPPRTGPAAPGGLPESAPDQVTQLPPAKPAAPSGPPLPEPDRPDATLLRIGGEILAGLRRHDQRLTLSDRDVVRLTPAVAAWLEREVDPLTIERALTTRLPQEPIAFAAAFLGRRLTDQLPPPLPAVRAQQAKPDGPVPMQNCDKCDRGFRAPEPGECRDCRPLDSAAGQVAAAAA